MAALLPASLHAAPGGDPPKAGMAVWDTTQPAGALKVPTDLGQKNWLALPGTADAFTGDAVLSNGRLVMVLRNNESSVEILALKPGAIASRMRLQLLERRRRARRPPGTPGPDRKHQGGGLSRSGFHHGQGNAALGPVSLQAGRGDHPDRTARRGGQAAPRMSGPFRDPARFLRGRHRPGRRQAAAVAEQRRSAERELYPAPYRGRRCHRHVRLRKPPAGRARQASGERRQTHRRRFGHRL